MIYSEILYQFVTYIIRCYKVDLVLRTISIDSSFICYYQA